MVHEFDLDGALARRPSLLLVDELAHTNPPGSRHPKRWQDVEELLHAGIDVWTALNVQHLESLNDVVLKITGIRVRETVPDHVFEDAAEIVLVDLPPDELLKRLGEGKVYMGETAVRAADGFFKPSNLIALRELALRRSAERIDSDLVQGMRARGIEGPWAAGERILALVGPDPASAEVVRAAKRMADLTDAPWIALTVERPGADSGRSRAAEILALAEELGAETATVIGTDIADEALRHARRENATQIFIGQSPVSWLRRLAGRSLPYAILRAADGIAVHVITTPNAGGPRRRAAAPAGFSSRRALAGLLWSFPAVAAAAFVAEWLEEIAPLPNLSMVFLTAVLAIAVSFGMWPAIFASVLSFAAYNFFFLPPYYTFSIGDGHDVLALAIFLIVAIAVSGLAGRVRDQAKLSSDRARATRRLYEFTRKLSGIAAADGVAEAAASEAHAMTGRATLLLLARNGDLTLTAAWPPEDDPGTAALAAARWAFSHNEPAGAGTGTLPNMKWLFLPLRTPRAQVGAMGLAVGETSGLDPETQTLFEALAEQTAAAIERADLARDMVVVKASAETERVRNILLASISHDFRTPLASILGATTTLTGYGERLDGGTRADLLDQIQGEAEHLDAMVRNLLSITRLEAGSLELRRDWIDLREIADRAVNAAKRRGATQTFQIVWPAELTLLKGDANLLDQAFGNIIGNAVKYGGAGAAIRMTATQETGAIAVAIEDDGPGIPPALLPHVFEKFVRARDAGADKGEGSGLGLAIAKGIVEAHGGTIRVESPASGGRGARFTIRLPVEAAP
jgi:two-component system sensor histidine kinase KdpD